MRVGDRWLARLALPLLALGAGALPGAPADEAPAKPVSYHKDIAPILARRCQGCHQPAKPGGKLDVTSHRSVLAGGRRGEGAVAGKPGESLVLQFLTGEKTPQIGGRYESRLTGKQTEEGEIEVETTHSPEGKQDAQRGYRETYDKYQKISEAVLESEPIPLGHRQTIRRYFEAIRPTQAEADKVLSPPGP